MKDIRDMREVLILEDSEDDYEDAEAKSPKLKKSEWFKDGVKFLLDGEYTFVLTEIIKTSPEMIGAVVYGTQRLGKTTYALQVLYDMYHDWDKVLSLTFFKLEELVSSLKKHIKQRERIDAIIWDDAGVYGSKYLFFSNKKLTEYLQKLFDVVGTAVKGIIITTPNPENLLKAIRGYEFYRVKIYKDGYMDEETRRVARGYKNVLLPSGKHVVRTVFNDYYDVTIPDDVYKEYKQMREGYTDMALDELEEILNKAKKKKKRKGEDDWEEEWYEEE